MIGHPALDAKAEGADLARLAAVRVAPAAGVSVAPSGLDAQRGARRDERRLESPDERAHEDAALVQRDDRIGHELAGAVIGHLTAALDADDLDTAAGQLVGAGPDVRLVAVPAERQDRRMLEEEQLVADPAVRSFRGEPTLEDVGFAVLDTTQPRGMQRGGPDGIEDGRGHRRTIAGRASRTRPVATRSRPPMAATRPGRAPR